MVIERALEKLKKTGALQAPGGAVQAPEPRPSQEVRSRPAARAVTVTALPTFTQVKYDRDVAISNRILLPDTTVAANQAASAAYRIIRTRLRQLARTNNLRSLAITSPGADEGKSVTALNLALSAARDPTQNVFLLDLDLRNPSVCRYLGVQPPRDLVSFFSGEAAPAEVLFTIGVDNLVIGASAVSTDQASELIGSGQLEALLAYIGSISASALVLIDLPPVLVTDEALLVAPRVDATLLVVAEGKTRRNSLTRAQAVLADFPCAGIILNGTREPIESYYEYA
jgi:protein-tyrosine kinase